MTTAAPALSASDLQKEAGEFVANNVYFNVGVFMDYCIKRAFEGDEDNPITEDDLNFEVDTSMWDDEQLKAYLDDNFSASWEDITGETWPQENSKEDIQAAYSHITQNSERQTRIDFGMGPVKEWDEETMREFIEDHMGDSWADVTGHRFPGTEISEEETEAVREYIRDNADPREPYEWWAVSSWLAARLKEKGDIIIDLGGGMQVWGRETTGQAIKLDGVIEELTLEILAERAKWAQPST